MTPEPLSYSARLKQRADLTSVSRLAESFLDLWADNAAEGSDEERAELAQARAEFDAVRALIDRAPAMAEMLAELAALSTDAEIQDASHGAQCLENDAAVVTLSGLIEQARALLNPMST